MTLTYCRLVELLRASLTNNQVNKSPFDVMSVSDWIDLQEYAAQHGVVAVAFAGIERLPIKVPKAQLLYWFGIAEYVKDNYKRQWRGAKAFAHLIQEVDAEMLVIKGLSLSKYYPDPAAREFGDLDVYTYDSHVRVNKLVESHNIRVDYWDKHDVFDYAGTHVEHHSYFVGRNSKSGKLLNERLLETIGRHKGVKVADNVYYPTPDFNVLFILSHTIGHMSYEGAILRNVLDFGLFLIKDGDNVHWSEVASVLEETGWITGFNVLVRVVEKVLAIDLSRFYIGMPDEKLSERVLNTILNTKLHQEENLPIVKRVIKKIRRLSSHKWMYSSGLIPANYWSDYEWGSLKEHLVRPEQF